VGAVPGVTAVEVDLAAGAVTVEGERVSPAAVAAAVEEAGYEVAS
jgi:copper chaperone